MFERQQVWTGGGLHGVNSNSRLRVIGIDGFDLLEINRWPGTRVEFAGWLAGHLGEPLPADPGQGLIKRDLRVLPVGPRRIWLRAPHATLEALAADDIGGLATVTDLSHARAVLSVAGADAPELLAKGLPVDLSVLGVGRVVMSAMHHVQVTLQVVATDDAREFELYVARSYARWFVEWIAEAGQEFGLAMQRD